MAESEAASRTQKLKQQQQMQLVSNLDIEMDMDMDMAEAAHQLMLLSDMEDSISSTCNSHVKKVSSDQEPPQQEETDHHHHDQGMLVRKRIEEIFETDENYEFSRRRKRKYRSLESIYRATKPTFLAIDVPEVDVLPEEEGHDQRT